MPASRIPFAALVAVLLAAPAVADDASDGPRLTIAEKRLDFGEVIHGQVKEIPVPIANRGNQALRLTQVKPSCGCTIARYPEELAPGATGQLVLTFDSNKRPPGHQSFRIAIYSNDSTQNDLGSNCTLLSLVGEVRTLFRLAPFGAYFGEFIAGKESVTKQLVVRGLEEAHREGFTLALDEELPDYLQVEIQPMTKEQVRLKVTLLPHAPLGELDRTIHFKTALAAQPRLAVAVNGLINTPIAGPTAVHFGGVPRLEGDTRLVAIERRDGGHGIEVAGLRYDQSLLEVELNVVSTQRSECTVKVKPGARPGPFAALLHILLDQPEQPLVTIPVYGRVLPRVQVEPEVVLLAAEPDADGAIGRVEVRVAGGGTITGADVVGDLDLGIEVRREDLGAGRVALTLLAEQVGVDRSQRLQLTTDVPGEETLEIPLVPR